MLSLNTPTSRQYRPAELKAIDYAHAFKKILDGTIDYSTWFDLFVKAEDTPYSNSPEDYLRYIEYPREMPHYFTELGYYTKNGKYHSRKIREKDDLDQYFHELLEEWDNLDLPGPEEYLGLGFYYDDVEVLIVDSLNWVAQLSAIEVGMYTGRERNENTGERYENFSLQNTANSIQCI